MFHFFSEIKWSLKKKIKRFSSFNLFDRRGEIVAQIGLKTRWYRARGEARTSFNVRNVRRWQTLPNQNLFTFAKNNVSTESDTMNLCCYFVFFSHIGSHRWLLPSRATALSNLGDCDATVGDTSNKKILPHSLFFSSFLQLTLNRLWDVPMYMYVFVRVYRVTVFCDTYGRIASTNKSNRLETNVVETEETKGNDVPRRQVTWRKQHHPWLPWFHQEGNLPSRPAPSTPSSRHMVSSGRFSSARGRWKGTGLDPRPPVTSSAAASSIISFLLEWLNNLFLSGCLLLSLPGRSSTCLLRRRFPTYRTMGRNLLVISFLRSYSRFSENSAADGLLLAARSGRPCFTNNQPC